MNTVCKLPDGKESTEFLVRRVKHHVVRLALRGICDANSQYLRLVFQLTWTIRHQQEITQAHPESAQDDSKFVVRGRL